jgi:hypothetical protein
VVFKFEPITKDGHISLKGPVTQYAIIP